MTSPRISVGIPLYCSRPFMASLRENCAALAAENDVEVIISDRHGFDDAFDLLHAEWGQDARFRFLRGDDHLNWVEHMNLLLREARGDYFRWMPHDDCFPAGCLTPLIEKLESTPSVIMVYAPTRALDTAGGRIPERDRLRSYPVLPGDNWTFQHSLDLFWEGYCDGAFKGLFRRREIIDANLFVRPTYRLVHAERAWLFGVSLLGGLAEEPASIYLKRYHPDSVHAAWRRGTRETISAASTMCGYLRDYGAGLSAKCFGAAYIWTRAIQRIQSRKARKMRSVDGVYSRRNPVSWPLLRPSVMLELLPQLMDRGQGARAASRRPNIQRILDELDREGVAILEDAAPKEMVAAALKDMERFVEMMPQLQGIRRTKRASNGGTREYEVHEYQRKLNIYRSHDPLMFSPAFAQFLLLADLIEVAKGYLGKHWLYQAMIATRTEPSEPIRGGFASWHHDARGRKLNIFLLLTDVPEDGPATIVLRGSHKLLYARARQEKIFLVTMNNSRFKISTASDRSVFAMHPPAAWFSLTPMHCIEAGARSIAVTLFRSIA